MLFIAFNLLFIAIFLCFIAHEKGWFDTRALSWCLCIEDFGKNRTWSLVLDSAFVALWVYLLFVNIVELIK